MSYIKFFSGLFTSAEVSASVETAKIEVFTSRILNAADYKVFRARRLRALREDGKYFGASLQEEVVMSNAQWQKKCAATDEHAIVGLFKDNQISFCGRRFGKVAKLVGILLVEKWKRDQNGKTLFWGAAYTMPEIRGRHYSRPMYELRMRRSQELASQHDYERAVCFVREGNNQSLNILLRNGAEIIKPKTPIYEGSSEPFPEKMAFADGSIAPVYWLTTKLKTSALGVG